jgi:hypothetical protein
MNKEQQELLDGVYVYYCKSFENQTLIEQNSFDTDPMNQYMFINKCKTDQEFSEKWGLKIEERELSYEERKKLCKLSDRVYPNNEWMKENNIPTQLITITYQTKTITSYE